MQSFQALQEHHRSNPFFSLYRAHAINATNDELTQQSLERVLVRIK
jgi:hypothetical protein